MVSMLRGRDNQLPRRSRRSLLPEREQGPGRKSKTDQHSTKNLDGNAQRKDQIMVTYEGKKYYTKKEAAKKLGLSIRGFSNRQYAAEVNHVKATFGRLTINLYTKEDLQKMLALAAWRKRAK